MSTFLEIEFKNLLDVDEYEYLYNFFGCDSLSNIKQQNYYLDTSDFALRAKNIALRIRNVENSDIVLTLKVPQEIGILEVEQLITPNEFNLFLTTNNITHINGEVKDYLSTLRLDTNLLLFMQFTTYRYEVNNSDGVFMLDKTVFENCTDYELELEVLDYNSGLIFFKNFLSNHNIDYKEAKPKIARALSYIK